MQRRAKISFLCLAGLLGVALASFQRYEFWVLGVFFLSGIICYVLGSRFLVFMSLVLVLSCVWFYVFARLQNPSLQIFDQKEIVVVGTIVHIERDGLNSVATISTKKIQDTSVHTLLNVKNNALENIEVGELVTISGNFMKPSDTLQRYYFTKGFSGDIFAINIQAQGFSLSGTIQKYMARLHDLCLKKLSSTFLFPVDAMLGALLLGAKTAVPQNIIGAFKNTGTTHILALSGYNISIIFTTMELFLAKLLKPKIRFSLAATFIVLFVLLVGPSSSIVRAAVMGILAGFVSRQNRITIGVTVLLFASTIMVILNPKILAFDVSFQLSALATFGIMAFEKVVEKYLQFLPNIFQIREILATTLSAQIPTLPILIYTFHSLSTVSLLSNILVLPLVPIIMATGFLGLLLSLVFLPLGKLFAPLPSLLVNLMDGTLMFLGRWNFSLLQLRIPLSVLIVYSIFVVIAFAHLQTKKYETENPR